MDIQTDRKVIHLDDEAAEQLIERLKQSKSPIARDIIARLEEHLDDPR